MLRRLELENFKSWERLEMDLKPITLIFGANSSGKTAILDALLMLKQTAESTDRGLSLRLGEPYRDLGSYHEVIHRHDDNRQLGIQLEWTPRKPVVFRLPALGGPVANPDVRYEAAWRAGDNVDLQHLAYAVPDFHVSLDRQDNGSYTATVDDSGKRAAASEDLPAPQSCYGVPRVLAQILPAYDLMTFSNRFEVMLDSVRHLGPLRESRRRVYQWSGEAPGDILQDGSSAIDALIAGERGAVPQLAEADYDLVDETAKWLARFGLAERFVVAPIDPAARYYEVRLTVPGAGGTETVLPDVGFGVSQLLPVVVQMLFVPEGSILLFEQPEIHLHPSAAAFLADLFLEVAHQRNLQLIIETHSEYLLTRLQRRIGEAERALANRESIALYFCELRDGTSQKRELLANEYGQIENWPDDFFGDSIGDLRAMTAAMVRRKSQGS